MKEKQVIAAGPLTMDYHEGTIRYIRWGDKEIIRMIFPAVRDHNWNTIEPSFLREEKETSDCSFQIRCSVEYIKGNIHFSANYTITGTRQATITFEMDGEAHSDFLKNRIGICLLHPLTECSGKLCTIIHPDNTEEQLSFPVQISPHQPFRNIASLKWPIDNDLYAELHFEGDIFETEDHRNWSDASYKTYSTPLDLPFPVLMKKGQKINQKIRLNFSRELQLSKEISSESRINFDRQHRTFPKLGMGSSGKKLTINEIALLRQLDIDHYRIEAYLGRPLWKSSLLQSIAEAKKLGWPVELVLFLPADLSMVMKQFAELIAPQAQQIRFVLLLPETGSTTDIHLFETACPILKQVLPNVAIGAGTNAYFAEVNRNRIDSAIPEFMSWSLNPQVHAFDNLSMVETFEAQKAMITSTKLIWPGKAVHLSPITLKPRFNPNATDKVSLPAQDEILQTTDKRQFTLFAAGWTIGTLSALTEAGADAATWFETYGDKGVIPEIPESTTCENVSPIFYLFRKITRFNAVYASGASVCNPRYFSALKLSNDKRVLITIANLTDQIQGVKLSGIEGQFTLTKLTEAKRRGESFQITTENLNFSGKRNEIFFSPFEIVFFEQN